MDGRAENEIRPLAAEVGVLPRVHGSGLFTRGQTQVLTIATLNTLSAVPEAGHHLGRGREALYAPLQLPRLLRRRGPGHPRPPAAASIGHGALAERALRARASPPWRSSPMPSAW